MQCNVSRYIHLSCSKLVAPLEGGCFLSTSRSEPWFNDVTRAARRECRRAEHKWKKDKLHVSCDLMRDSWRRYQKFVKEEKTKHFSDIISSQPRVLFKTVDSI